MSANVPREILKWMQSLDLSYSIKNMRRDFSNGFLIAEIISRYFSQEVEMHSFDIGVGVKAKMDNWQLLEKFFRKHGLNISRKVIDDLIACRPNSLNVVLEEVYTFLTEKSVKKAKPIRLPTVNVPNFAKPTVSKTNKDDGRAAVSSFVMSKRNQISSAKGNSSNNNTNNEIPSLEITFRDSKSSSTQRSKSSNQQQQMAATALLANIFIDMNDIIEAASCNESDIISEYRLDRGNLIASFLEKINSIPVEHSEGILNSIKERIPLYSEMMSAQPKDFWKFMNIFIPAVRNSSATVFQILCSILITLGIEMVSRDPESTWEAVEDFALDKFVETISTQASKREEIVQIVYSFTTSDFHTHKRVISKLVEKCSKYESHLIIHILALLVRHESSLLTIYDSGNGPIFNDDQVDFFEVYMNHAISGLSNPSPKVRASSLSIVHTLLSYDDITFDNKNETKSKRDNSESEVNFSNQPLLYIMENLWSQSIEPLENDNWWEVTAQLIVLTSKCLTQVKKLYMVDNIQEHEDILIAFLERLLARELSSTLKSIILSYVSSHLKTYSDRLTSVYLDILFSITEEERVALLEQPSNHVELLQVGNSQYKFPIMSIPFEWDSLTVAKVVSDQVVNLDHLEVEHYDVLNACISIAQLDQPEDDKTFKDSCPSEWLEIYDRLQNHFFVGLVDEELCEMAAQLIVKFFSVLKKEVVKSMAAQLVNSIEIIYGGNQFAHQQAIFSQFLIDVYSLGSPFSQPLMKLASSLMEQSHLTTNQHLGKFVSFVRNNMM
ncbi:hypothetical protein NAEGRDRAFT_65518 [Naegleria gruberi]|uniref:Spermatogenesis-associated protein 4 n=1 Tax=Naegleria gruberi TaxID=5762 RepID=D2V9Q2_NAEGR|nr:uncharacterized protein NAEGRDRAFT_65518 [Naegleria gruberi]EFC46503.1 hypothetical protein NAEGRDRAFT_65518 [Naegleria gruberi]|eukprot:XP_002679247.1 hypothetical protein NAEGRDRAFT_65518 [Naegleria gruberi strain NEG-M]